MTSRFDIVFLGHICRDRIVHFGHDPVWSTGGAGYYGSIAAVRVGMSVAVVARMRPADRTLLSEMESSGVRMHVIPASETTELEVVYPSDDVENRRIFRRSFAGRFVLSDVEGLSCRCIHLAGNTSGEFPLDIVKGLRKSGRLLAVDMQGFVRQCDPSTGEISFRDVPEKREIFGCVDVVKLDVVEAEMLTGAKDARKALETMAGWGCREIVLTRTRGVLGCFGGAIESVEFTNRGSDGRNGRGDSTFAGYLSRRLDHSPSEALKFAGALASLKLEKRGPFSGNLQDVLNRM